jgi:tetratricopeptide (TPR) repeat protein
MICRALALTVVAASFAIAQEPGPALWRKCGSEIGWMTDKRPLKDDTRGGALGKTDVDLEELWSDVKAKSKETGKPILWYIPKVEGSHMYRGAILDHYMNVAVWSDEAVVDLVQRRFVPFRAACAKELKEESKIDRWRVVEPAIIILDSDGRELHFIQRIRTFNADFIAAALRAALDKHDPVAAPDASGEELMKGGWFAEAAKKLGSDPLKLAELRRREGKFEEALKLCDAAKGGEVATVRGRTLLAAGRVAEAKAELQKAGTPEGAYYLGVAERLSGRDDEAKAIWSKLVESSPETRWGWRASANTTLHKDDKPYGPAATGFEDVFWCAAPAAGATTTKWERTPADAEDIARRAVAWLLKAQSSNGGWTDARYAFWPSPEIQPNVHMAVTGLACTALLQWRELDPARIDAALEKGEKFLLDDSKLARGKNEESYAEAYRLLYLSNRAASAADKKKLVGRMDDIVATLASMQDQGGFWSHEYPNPFVTASVLQVLQKAKRAGVTVPDAVFSRGSDALKKSRDDKGRQGYDAGRKGSTDFSSSGRNSMAEAALLEDKATDRKSFEAAMEQFWAFLERRENVRVCDFHSDGELAGFFFFNNFYHTTEAAALLEGKARQEAYARGLAHLVRIPEIDGSFIDSHEMGKSYGTASALLSLRNCLKK